MTAVLTKEEREKANEEFARRIAEILARARRNPPRLDRIAPPIDLARLRALRPGPIYEGFEEDLKRMRQGLEPLGPRKMKPVERSAMTKEEREKANEEFARDLAEILARARRNPPRLERIAPPIDPARLTALSPGPLYEGFREDLKRMRRGLEPLGPRK